MLSNIVGTLLAFVTIMLMLSLIVTSLVQFTQATLRLRGRNLLFGVAALIQDHAPNVTPAGNPSPLRSNPHLAVAAHVLNNADASLKYLADPNATARVLMGPPVSWVKSDDLARAVVSTLPAMAGGPAAGAAVPTTPPAVVAAANAAPAVAGSAAAVKQTFENMEPALSKRFQFIIRIWTVAWSFVIAFAFQVSTLDLLRNLPVQETKREAILAAVPNLTNDATRKLAFSTDDVLEESIKRLSDKFPQYKDLFEEVSGDKGSKVEMTNEMRNVLGKQADKEQVLNEYSSIIDTVTKGAATTAYDHTSQLINQLDTFGIYPKNNFEFFVSAPLTYNDGNDGKYKIHWGHILGVLITGILLSLGAPFWFEQLKNLSSLRDAMSPSAVTAKAKT
jgi:hypothetical protein